MNLKFQHFILIFMLGVYALVNYSSNEYKERHRNDLSVLPMGNYDTTKLDIDPRLTPILEEFITDAEYYGYDTRFVNELNSITIGDIDTVMIDGEESHLHGVCLIGYERGNRIGRIILSEELYKQDPIGFKMVFYHEMGHWMGKDHLPHLEKKDEFLLEFNVLNINKFIGIMHDGYSVSDSSYIRDMWIPLKHNFFVRDMPLDEQKKFTHKVLNEEIDKQLLQLECYIDELDCDPSKEDCIRLDNLESLDNRLSNLSWEDMEGLFEL